MPLYEYQCLECSHRMEVIRRFSDDPLTECPQCGGELEKLISAPAFRFKGSGWYITDYAKKDGAKKEGAKEGSSKEGGAKDSGEAGSKDSGSKDSGGGSEKVAEPKASKADPKAAGSGS